MSQSPVSPVSPRDHVLGSNLFFDVDGLIEARKNVNDMNQAVKLDALVASTKSAVIAIEYGKAVTQERLEGFDAIAFSQQVVNSSQTLKKTQSLILSAVASEADQESAENVPFRNESVPCRILKACLQQKAGEDMERIKLACFHALAKACQVKTSKKFWQLGVGSGMSEAVALADDSVMKTYLMVAQVLQALSSEVEECEQLKPLLQTLRSASEVAFNDNGDDCMGPKMVSNLVFLRYLSPWLVQLDRKDPLVKKLKGKTNQKRFVQAAKVVGKILMKHAAGNSWEGQPKVFNRNQILFDGLVDSLSLVGDPGLLKDSCVDNN